MFGCYDYLLYLCVDALEFGIYDSPLSIMVGICHYVWGEYKAGWSILAPLSVSQMTLSYGKKS